MRDVLDDLRVAAVRRVVVTGAALRAAGPPATSPSTPFGGHALRLAALRLGELRGDHDQAQVEHEERTDLNKWSQHFDERPHRRGADFSRGTM